MKIKTQNKNLESHMIEVLKKRNQEIRETLNNLNKGDNPSVMFNYNDE